MHHDCGVRRSYRRQLVGSLILGLLTAAVLGCDGQSDRSLSGGISSDQAIADAKVVWRADLERGSTGKMASVLTQRFIHLDGVGATHGDSGQHLWVYSTSHPTAAQRAAIGHLLWTADRVDSVRRLR